MFNGLNYKKILGITALSVVVVFNLYLASKPEFYPHLQTDIVTYYYRSGYFLENGSYFALENNEYQPGGLAYFALLSQPLRFKNDFAFFKQSVFVVNIIFVFLLYLIYKKVSGESAVYIYSLVLLFTGPIFLFRFDLYVMIFIITSFYFWRKKREDLSLLFLSWATLTKIFPVIFLPYYLILSYKKRGLKNLMKIAAKFLAYTFILLLIFIFLFKFDFKTLVSSWNFLAHVPVNTESVWGSLLSLYSIIFQGRMARGLGDWGTFGISPGDTIGPLWFYSSISFIVIAFFYFWIFIKNRNDKFEFKIPLAVILTYLVFSRVIHHQYTLWYMLLLPLLGSNLFLKDGRWRLNIILALSASVIYIYIYPLHFTEVITRVYANGTSLHLFWINLFRNFVLIILWLRVVFEVGRHKLPGRKQTRTTT